MRSVREQNKPRYRHCVGGSWSFFFDQDDWRCSLCGAWSRPFATPQPLERTALTAASEVRG